MERFVELLLIILLGRKTFSDLYVVERAHCSLASRPPRRIIERLLNYRDAALRRAHDLGELQSKGAPVSLFPYIIQQVQETRRQFLLGKQKLTDLKLEYNMLYLSCLRVIVGRKALVLVPGQELVCKI
ncbi:hypothetical protein NDU88_000020 [Pleurodeles waltl]|uniref:Uncharacterized protein n=1 Tax=Pleurodeles waltl TaxID=8319 RepID=A0AAV7NA74_PLEWA|nr:hypothetical protein NDU88_000020 [Pleurodeles waltl]